MMPQVRFPEHRFQVIDALRSLSDRQHQQTNWGRYEEGVNYYDDLDLNVSILYDDTEVLPNPETAVPGILHADEVHAVRAVDAALGPLIRDLGNRPDAAYIADPRWSDVVSAAAAALAQMQACDGG